MVVAEIDLRFVGDVISQPESARRATRTRSTRRGRLIAHPDTNLVLRRTSFADAAAGASGSRTGGAEAGAATTGRDHDGTEVLSAYQTIDSLGWRVFVEEPLSEAFAPLESAIRRTALLLVDVPAAGDRHKRLLVRRLVRPIESIQVAAARIGPARSTSGSRSRANDELGALAEEFNRMAEQLEGSYAGLEQKVEERTQELATALGELDERAASSRLRAGTSRSSWRTCRTSCGRR